MKRKLVFFVSALFVSISSIGAQTEQKAVVVFEETSHDFGTFKEEVGYANHDFKFKNTGKAPLILNSVRASCGCTTPNWSREPIAPGESGTIQVRYSAKNRPGAFRKTITVSSNASNSQVVLSISGTVTPRERTITELYPRKVGLLNVKTDQIAFGRIGDVAVGTKTIEVANNTSNSLSLDFSMLPLYLKAKASSVTLSPQEKGSIDFAFDPKVKNEYGSLNEPITVKINGKEATFTLSALVQEDFSGMSAEEKANAPVIVIDPYIVNFGSLAKGTSKTFEFTIKNDGQSELIIRQVTTNNEELTIRTPSKPIKAGHADKIVVEMKLSGSTGRKNFVINLVQNDPARPTASLRIMGNVTD